MEGNVSLVAGWGTVVDMNLTPLASPKFATGLSILNIGLEWSGSNAIQLETESLS